MNEPLHHVSPETCWACAGEDLGRVAGDEVGGQLDAGREPLPLLALPASLRHERVVARRVDVLAQDERDAHRQRGQQERPTEHGPQAVPGGVAVPERRVRELVRRDLLAGHQAGSHAGGREHEPERQLAEQPGRLLQARAPVAEQRVAYLLDDVTGVANRPNQQGQVHGRQQLVRITHGFLLEFATTAKVIRVLSQTCSCFKQ